MGGAEKVVGGNLRALAADMSLLLADETYRELELPPGLQIMSE